MAQFLGKEIIDECPCGVKVGLDDRQDMVFDFIQRVWKRVCRKCINSNATFTTDTDTQPQSDEPVTTTTSVVSINGDRS